MASMHWRWSIRLKRWSTPSSSCTPLAPPPVPLDESRSSSQIRTQRFPLPTVTQITFQFEWLRHRSNSTASPIRTVAGAAFGCRRPSSLASFRPHPKAFHPRTRGRNETALAQTAGRQMDSHSWWTATVSQWRITRNCSKVGGYLWSGTPGNNVQPLHC